MLQPSSQGLLSYPRPMERARRDPGLSSLAPGSGKMRHPAGNEVVNDVVFQMMMHSNVIVGITTSRGLVLLRFLRSLAVGVFDLANCSLSIVGFVPVFNVGQLVS